MCNDEAVEDVGTKDVLQLLGDEKNGGPAPRGREMAASSEVGSDLAPHNNCATTSDKNNTRTREQRQLQLQQLAILELWLVLETRPPRGVSVFSSENKPGGTLLGSGDAFPAFLIKDSSSSSGQSPTGRANL